MLEKKEGVRYSDGIKLFVRSLYETIRTEEN